MKISSIVKMYGKNQRILRFFDFYYGNLKLESIRNPDKDVDEKILTLFNEYKEKIEKGYPIEYIFNKAYFYGLELFVDNSVLIPRDETEELVQWVLEDYKNEKNNVLDLCSGSGCIGLSLKKNRNNWNVTCSDISCDAINIIKKNSSSLNLKVDTVESDLFKNINGDYDIIISNPPYIAKDDPDVAEAVEAFEPHLALYTNDKFGIEFYDKIFNHLSNIIFKNAYFEFGYLQKDLIEQLANKYHLNYLFRKDFNGKDRMIKVSKKPVEF